jgi:hypothetical protein
MVLDGQTGRRAVELREKHHRETPVSWYAAADLETLALRQRGHVLSQDHALAEEAILTASGIHEADVPTRGGPWAGPWLSAQWRSEAETVYRISQEATSARAARQAVIAHGAVLGAGSALQKHLTGMRFRRDSAESRMGPPAVRKSSRPSGSNLSGHEKRLRKGWSYASWIHMRHKWGSAVETGRRLSNARRCRGAH